MAPDAPPRNCSHFMQICNASVTLTQSASDFCQRPSARSFCPGMPRRYFPYFLRLPGNGKRICNGSITRLQKCGISGTLNLLDDLPLLRPAHMAYVDGMDVDVVWCAESMTDPSPCSSLNLSGQPRHYSCSDHVCVMHAPDHVHTKRSQGSSAFALRAQASEQSDTLETRTKLTSHSALECGGLPQLPTPTLLQRSQRRPQV